MRPLLVLFGLLASLLAGCAESVQVQDFETSPPPETIEEGSATLVGGEECTNPEAGYTIGYPGAWYANSGDVTTPCTVFDDAPVRLEQQTEIPLDLGVVMGSATGTIEEHLQGLQAIRVEERTETEVAGRTAVIVRGRGTGDALIPEGTRVHRYLVQLPDDQVLIASTYDTGDAAFARKIEVLDAMMGSLRFGS